MLPVPIIVYQKSMATLMANYCLTFEKEFKYSRSIEGHVFRLDPKDRHWFIDRLNELKAEWANQYEGE